MSDLDGRLADALKRHRGGDLAAAIAAYRAILAQAPDHAEALHLLGVATLQSGDARGAADWIGRAIAQAPGVAKYHVNLGEARRLLGDLDGALESCRAAIALDADNAAARNNLGAVLLRLGRNAEAREALEALAERAPRDAQAQANLGQARWRLGAVLPALDALANAVLLAPQNLSYRQLLVRVARDMPSPELPPQVWKQLLDCFAVPGVDPQPVARAVLAIARGTPEFRAVAELAEQPLEVARQGLAGGTGAELLNSVLLSDLLFQTLIADPVVETMLIRLRRLLLVETADPSRAADQGVIGEQPLFAAGLAAQAHANGYLWPIEAEERALVERLAGQLAQDAILGRLTSGDRAALQRFLLVAAYRPLSGPDAAALGGVAGVIEMAAERFAPRLRQLVRRQITAVKREAELGKALQRLGAAAIDETAEVSDARWQSLDKRPPVALAERIAALFPGLGFRPPGPRALVAGCGMGKTALELAAQLADAPVTAIDTRRADLAYARRMAQDQGVPGIAFRLGTAAELAASDARFALIEANAFDELTALAGLLAPGGVLKLVLPSRRRAAAIAAAQTHVAAARLETGDLEAARRRLLDLPADHPAREITGWDGFYARPSAARLLFGAVPAGIDVDAARGLLAEHGLEWLGLQREDRIFAASAGTELTLQIWARRPA